MLPACLVRAAPGRWLLAPPGWALLGTGTGPGLCLKWRRQPPGRELALLLRAARRSIGTRAGGLRAEKPGDSSDKHVSVQRGRREETLLSAAQKGGLFYVIFKELFSSSSPSKIYGDALEKCRSHPEIIGVFGESIKGYGEATRRGRRQLVSHVEYVKDGLKHMRLKFYIEGSEPGKRGTVHVEVKENPERGRFEVRYIFVDVDTYPRRTIVIEDNR
ncbi:PREDICTED: mitochondrial import inner membrane translocase subunit Tim21 isoform X2 [Haliaeetus leucocephalus]|uniref:mitochondrial import inner membrane translocase subunit Tim21 isoform X2 n=1 Tax=Haliaeetus leucocephalus TaxID=52644 RepID=UPI00053CD706|nr:PREDICTED: mitochondrial import inner membrane translocase subunit Tim21 isoform X2 [Haliaeetus leucocephalus]